MARARPRPPPRARTVGIKRAWSRHSSPMEPGRAGGASPARVSRLARAEPKILVPVIRHRSGAVRVAGARPRPLPRARAVGIKGREAGMHPSWNPDALEARARRRLRPRTTRDWARVSRMARAEPKILVPVIRHRPGVVRVARARPRPPPRSRTVGIKGRGAGIRPPWSPDVLEAEARRRLRPHPRLGARVAPGGGRA